MKICECPILTWKEKIKKTFYKEYPERRSAIRASCYQESLRQELGVLCLLFNYGQLFS